MTIKIYGISDDTIIASDKQFTLKNDQCLLQIGEDVMCRLTYNNYWSVEYFYLKNHSSNITINHMKRGTHRYSDNSEIVYIKNIDSFEDIRQLV